MIGRQENPPHATAVKRLTGYCAALRRAGIRYERKLAPAVSGAPYGKAMGAAAAHKLSALPARPDAIYCFADVLALGALRAAHEHGLQSARQFGLADFDGIDEGKFSVPTLTTIAVDFTDIAHVAVNALVERMRSKTTIPHRELRCRYELIIGESSRRAARRAAVG